MIRSIVARLLCAGAAAVVFACAGPNPWVREGDANSVEISYAGDIDRAWPLARRHCARFERVARLADPGLDIAVFDCVRP